MIVIDLSFMIVIDFSIILFQLYNPQVLEQKIRSSYEKNNSERTSEVSFDFLKIKQKYKSAH